MNHLEDLARGWVAGIYEGEGTCGIRHGRDIRVSVTMTDLDVVDRLYDVVGIGSVRGPLDRGNKPFKVWSVGGYDCVVFLQAILPLLGERRREKAEAAIDNWLHNRKQSSKGDATCVNGHDKSKTKQTLQGTCRECANLASQRYRAKRKLSSSSSPKA